MVGPNDATGYRIGYQELVSYVQELGIAEKVRLLPSVPLSDLVSIYSNSMMFASPSLYEGFGFTPLEAMSCEVPVVASNTTALPEVCESAVLYANPHDASSFANQFNLLLDDQDLRENLIVAGNKQVLKFDWKETARKTLNVLNNVAVSRK
jgi:glycosyltransferase involved in cell wall biosynthesis